MAKDILLTLFGLLTGYVCGWYAHRTPPRTGGPAPAVLQRRSVSNRFKDFLTYDGSVFGKERNDETHP